MLRQVSSNHLIISIAFMCVCVVGFYDECYVIIGRLGWLVSKKPNGFVLLLNLNCTEVVQVEMKVSMCQYKLITIQIFFNRMRRQR